MNNIETYICLNCRDIGKEDLVRILKQKMAQNLNDEDSLQLEIVNLRLICDKLKSENGSEMGFGEKLLNDKRCSPGLSWQCFCRKPLQNCIKKL